MPQSIHVEIHGVSGGQQLWDLKDSETGLTKYLKETSPGVDWLVTAITDREEQVLGRTNNKGVVNHPFLRIYHDYGDTTTINLVVEIIRAYRGMYRYGVQIISMQYIPPSRDGHLP